MSMDPHYQSIYNQVRDLQFQVHDAMDNPNHPTAHVLRNEIQELHEDLEKHKNPRDLENRIKTIQHGMLEARSQQNSFMSIPDADHFHRTFEDMRMNIRKFPNY